MNNVFLFANVPLFFLHRERSAAANRMSHIFGLTGPTSTAETACWEPRVPSEIAGRTPNQQHVQGSSSLVALGIAQMTMRRCSRNSMGEPQNFNHVIMIFHVFPNVNHQ